MTGVAAGPPPVRAQGRAPGLLFSRAGGGGSNPVQGLRIYSLANPSLPAFVGEWNDRYCHDAQVVTWTEAPYEGVEVAFCYANDTSFSGNLSLNQSVNDGPPTDVKPPSLSI